MHRYSKISSSSWAVKFSRSRLFSRTSINSLTIPTFHSSTGRTGKNSKKSKSLMVIPSMLYFPSNSIIFLKFDPVVLLVSHSIIFSSFAGSFFLDFLIWERNPRNLFKSTFLIIKLLNYLFTACVTIIFIGTNKKYVSPKKIGSKDVSPKKIRPPKTGSKKFSQNQVSNSWDIADID